MYCPTCGAELSETQKYCSECGTQIPLQKDTQAKNVQQHANQKNYPNFSVYLDKYIRKATTFTSVASLINGAQPTKFKWLIISMLCLLGYMSLGIGGIIVGLLISFIIIRLTLLILLIVRCCKEYTSLGQVINVETLDNLAIFLENNLDSTHFTAWQRGKPVTFGVLTADLLVIECKFNNKTYHRIVFDPEAKGTYKIEASRATAKERLKDGGDTNPSSLYKSDYIVRPILEAATKYYFRYVMHPMHKM